MRIAGLVGGIAPGSTIDYYRLLVAACQKQLGPTAYPALLINSIDLTRMLRLAAADDHAPLAQYLLEEVERLARAGAAFGAFASNTPHVVIDEVRRRASIPLLSIVEVSRDAIVARGLRRVGLLGTRFTMEGGFYQRVLGAAGVEVVLPEAPDLALVHERYVRELIPGLFLDDTRDELLTIIDRLATAEQVDAVILGGTELPLLLRGVRTEVPLIDTTALHVDAILEEMLLVAGVAAVEETTAV